MDAYEIINISKMLLKEHEETYFLGSILDIVTYKEANIKTMGVTIENNKIVLLYDKNFIDILKYSRRMLAYILAHEAMHIFNFHIKSFQVEQLPDKDLINIATDMIINTFLDNNYRHIIKAPTSRYIIPNNYVGAYLTEELYKFLQENNKINTQEPIYKNALYTIKNLDKLTNEQFDELRTIYEKEKNKKLTNEEVIEELINDALIEYASSICITDVTQIKNIYDTLNIDAQNNLKGKLINTIQRISNIGKLPDNAKIYIQNNIIFDKYDYITKIKHKVNAISKYTFKKSTIEKTYMKPSRRDQGIDSIKKGKKKQYNNVYFVILDVSGSMENMFNKVLSYLNDENSSYLICTIDTEVNGIHEIKDLKELKDLKMTGLGGTNLQPAIDLYIEKYMQFPLIILTDGFISKPLDFHNKMKTKCVIITCDKNVEFRNNNNNVFHYNVSKIIN